MGTAAEWPVGPHETYDPTENRSMNEDLFSARSVNDHESTSVSEGKHLHSVATQTQLERRWGGLVASFGLVLCLARDLWSVLDAAQNVNLPSGKLT